MATFLPKWFLISPSLIASGAFSLIMRLKFLIPILPCPSRRVVSLFLSGAARKVRVVAREARLACSSRSRESFETIAEARDE